MNTWEITKEIEELRTLSLVEEFDEDTGELIDNSKELQELLNELNIKRDDKLIGIEYIKREYQSINDTIDAEMKRLKDRKAKFDKHIEKLSNLEEFLLNGEKVETDLFSFSFRKSTSVNVDDVNIATIKGKYVQEKTTFSIKKADVKKALQDGEEIEGAFLETKQNLQVK